MYCKHLLPLCGVHFHFFCFLILKQYDLLVLSFLVNDLFICPFCCFIFHIPHKYSVDLAPFIQKTLLPHRVEALSFSLIKGLYMYESISGISIMSILIKRVLLSYQSLNALQFFPSIPSLFIYLRSSTTLNCI